MGDANLKTCSNRLECKPESVIVANGILNEILDKALEIALSTSYDRKDSSKKMNIIDEMQDSNEDSKKVPRLEQEMKKFLNEMMAPPYENVNYENVPRKDGVGDQPVNHQAENLQIEPSKRLEKKTRITDLVMNSKKVLNNLLDEEGRKKQEDWEEDNENVIQVIELQNKNKDKVRPRSRSPEIKPEDVPFPVDENEEYLQEIPDDSTLEQVDLKGGEGDEGKVDEIQKKVSFKDIEGEKCASRKKKKWGFSFKFFGLKKNRNKQSQATPSNIHEK